LGKVREEWVLDSRLKTASVFVNLALLQRSAFFLVGLINFCDRACRFLGVGKGTPCGSIDW